MDLSINVIRLDGGTHARVTLDDETIDEYAEAMQDGATFPPVVVFHDGADYWLADGFLRVHAAMRLEQLTIQADVRPGSRREAILFAVGANAAHGLRRSNADKRRAVSLLLKDPEWRAWTDCEIARRCGVSDHMVGMVRRDLVAENIISPSPDRVFVRNGVTGAQNFANVGRARAQTLALKEKRAHVMQVMGSSDSPEWYTPREIVELATALLGEIDLDPASCAIANQVVGARKIYTVNDDGLRQPWHGRVFLNPPYGSEIPYWVNKLIEAHDCGRGGVKEAIALLPGRIDTAWFQPLYQFPLCHVRGRLQFENSPYNCPFPTVIAYLGERLRDFIGVFGQLGPIMRRVG